MTFDTIIRGASVVSACSIDVADVGIANGKIVAVGDLSSEAAIDSVQAAGLHLMAGGIDTQVHFREPGLTHKEDLESGTRAALHGGITTVLEMPNTSPTTTTREAIEDKLTRAAGRSWVNYGFFVGATTENSHELAALEQLPGVPGVKIFMGSSTGPLLVASDDDLRRVLKNGRGRCPIHAEDEVRNRNRKSLISATPHAREHPFLRDSESAILATNRILALSRETNRPVHVLHISTGEEPFIIQDAKRSLDVTCEVTPQHLYFAGPEAYDTLGTHVQMNPPIRSVQDREAIWRALDEDVFDVFGSDHAPHTLEEKAQPYPSSPSGMPGVQTMLSVLLTFYNQGRLSLTKIARMLCERPAELYGMTGKGRIEAGYDADLVLFDPAASYRFERSMVQSRCGWSPYEGAILNGRIDSVWIGGTRSLREGERVTSPVGTMVRFNPRRPIP